MKPKVIGCSGWVSHTSQFDVHLVYLAAAHLELASVAPCITSLESAGVAPMMWIWERYCFLHMFVVFHLWCLRVWLQDTLQYLWEDASLYCNYYCEWCIYYGEWYIYYCHCAIWWMWCRFMEWTGADHDLS